MKRNLLSILLLANASVALAGVDPLLVMSKESSFTNIVALVVIGLIIIGGVLGGGK